MAIIVEEVKAPRKWGTIISVILVIIAMAVGIYFLFFKKPILIEMVIPIPAEITQELSQLQFDPLSIQNNEVFKTLRQYTSLPTAGDLGRTNPFLPF
jgi:predicted PurR-regulated permease PerM